MVGAVLTFEQLQEKRQQQFNSSSLHQGHSQRTQWLVGHNVSVMADNGVMLYQKGGRNRERNCRILHVIPPTFCMY